jgi:hypothetical protein
LYLTCCDHNRIKLWVYFKCFWSAWKLFSRSWPKTHTHILILFDFFFFFFACFFNCQWFNKSFFFFFFHHWNMFKKSKRTFLIGWMHGVGPPCKDAMGWTRLGVAMVGPVVAQPTPPWGSQPRVQPWLEDNPRVVVRQP